jgi:hypothetical protein
MTDEQRKAAERKQALQELAQFPGEMAQIIGEGVVEGVKATLVAYSKFPWLFKR